MNDTASPRPASRGVVIILLVALAIRLAMSVTLPLDHVSDDAAFYVRMAKTPLEGHPFLSVANPLTGEVTYYTSVGPLYPAFLLPFFAALPGGAALLAVRLVQALLSTLGVWLVYRAGVRLFGRGAGLVAMAAMALDVRFILEAPDLTTETLYITLQVAGFALYLAAVQSERLRGFVWSGAVFGLATLTRPVPLALPLALAFHALLASQDRARLLKGVGVMALALWAVATPWVVRNAIVTGGQLIPVSDTAASTFWLGSTDDGRYHGHEEFYEARAEDIGDGDYGVKDGRYFRAGLRNVLAQPLNYLGTRARNTLGAYLQPYGTVNFEGPSIKEVAASWLRGEASLGDVVSIQGFWPKLVVYAFHFPSLGLGLFGLALSWRRWREVLPLALMLAYGTAVYAVLVVLPRYLFPLMPFYWVAAGYALVWLWGRVTRRNAAVPLVSGAKQASAPQPGQE
jgi:4-amino-4-deoxy-L-arabinose transferase-like glycosyltransferase